MDLLVYSNDIILPITLGLIVLLSSNEEIFQRSNARFLFRFLKDVKKHTFKADKRDPEFGFFSGTEFTMNAYK